MLSEKFEWKCEGRKIERVSEFKYLGHTFNETATDKPHSEEGKQDSGMCVGNGKRKWGGDFRRRMMMFESMVESVLIYGTEMWGWQEQEEVERVQEEY
jgi:hypothetical protein